MLKAQYLTEGEANMDRETKKDGYFAANRRASRRAQIRRKRGDLAG
jgi:hypothetical protein